MNYLAHIHLSGLDMRVAVGNFIGDGVKGRLTDAYPRHITVGLHLHRFIDSMADNHPVNAKARQAMHPVFGKYAGVVQDMLHDHFLARFWSDFEKVPIHDFLNSFYASADEYLDIFPTHQLRFLEGIRAGGWLMNYADFSGMDRAFNGLSKRIKRDNPLLKAGEHLRTHHEMLESQFRTFYPMLQSAASEELERLLTTM